MSKEIKQKVCSKCHKAFAATLDNFRRDSKSRDSLCRYCKPCVRAMQRDLNKEYYKRAVNEKGVLGFRCPLWTQRCECCVEINTCWRLMFNLPANFPVKLVGDCHNLGPNHDMDSLHKRGK